MAISVRSDQLSKQASKGGNETFHFIHILIYPEKIDCGGLSPAMRCQGIGPRNQQMAGFLDTIFAVFFENFYSA